MGHGDLELLPSRFRHHADNTGARRNLLASPGSNLPLGIAFPLRKVRAKRGAGEDGYASRGRQDVWPERRSASAGPASKRLAAFGSEGCRAGNETPSDVERLFAAIPLLTFGLVVGLALRFALEQRLAFD